MAEIKNSRFVLKPAYKNVQRKSIFKEPLTNENLTNDLALQFIGYHPKGYGLFKTLPKVDDYDIKKHVLELETVLDNRSYKTDAVKNAFEIATEKVMVDPTPYKFQVYFKKLSRAKRNKVIAYLNQEA